MDSQKKNIKTCRRCGTCCRKGGPALHLQDRELVESGVIPLASLYTIRIHEPAFDNVAGLVAPARTDIIKVRPRAEGRTTCAYYRQNPPGCSIYRHRPLECRALQCWDTTEIESLYRRDRLTREHLLAGQAGLWDLIIEHQERCDYKTLADLASRLKGHPDDKPAAAEILAMVRYDKSLRDTVRERTGLAPGLFDFLFGRPLPVTLALFDLKLVKSPDSGEYRIMVL